MADKDDKDQKERLKRALELTRGRVGGAVPAAPAAAAPAPAPSPAASPKPGLPVVTMPQPVAPAAGEGEVTKLPRLLDALMRLLQPRPTAPPQPSGGVQPDPSVFTIVVAALANDVDGSAGAALQRCLAARATLKVKSLSKIFQLDSLEDPGPVAAIQLNTRHAVADEGADLLVWGDMVKEGYRLRLATTVADDDRAGAFGPATRIELPLDLGEGPANMLYAAVLAAAEAVSETQKAAVRRLLPAAAAAVEALAVRPPVQLSMGQQRTYQMVFGHIAATTAQVLPPEQGGPWFDKAVGAYRQAQRRLNRADPAWENGLLHRHIAAAITARAEREKQPAPLLEEAAKEWRSASETLTRAIMPQEWATTQVRLGAVLYRLDLLTGQTELLREALQVLQSTLQVYSRTETPQRWAEVMHSVAQVLEVYGDQVKSADVLKRAIDTCHSVLEIRTRERSPLAWASTQNTLGSALFMLDRHTDGGGHLEEAEQALAGALEVFQAHGAKGPAKVAAKNLSHVRKMAESHRGRPIVDPHWAER
jgi:hypothetical protein